MSDMESFTYARSEEEHSLEQLHHWLRNEGLTGLLGGGAFWLPYGLVMTVLVVLAALFTPYMLWHLFKARWYKSIVAFVLVVMVPFAVSRFMQAEVSVGYYLLSLGPLALFYLYTWILRHVIGEHISELHMVRQLESQDRWRDV